MSDAKLSRGALVALWQTNIVIQAFVFVTWFAEYTFSMAPKMTSAMTLVPYLLLVACGFKRAWTGQTGERDARSRNADRSIAAVVTACAAGMLNAGGAKFLPLPALGRRRNS